MKAGRIVKAGEIVKAGRIVKVGRNGRAGKDNFLVFRGRLDVYTLAIFPNSFGVPILFLYCLYIVCIGQIQFIKVTFYFADCYSIS